MGFLSGPTVEKSAIIPTRTGGEFLEDLRKRYEAGTMSVIAKRAYEDMLKVKEEKVSIPKETVKGVLGTFKGIGKFGLEVGKEIIKAPISVARTLATPTKIEEKPLKLPFLGEIPTYQKKLTDKLIAGKSETRAILETIGEIAIDVPIAGGIVKGVIKGLSKQAVKKGITTPIAIENAYKALPKSLIKARRIFPEKVSEAISKTLQKEIKIPRLKPKIKPPKPPIQPTPPPIELPQFAGKPVEEPVAKLNELLKKARPARGRLETKYTKERAKRIAKVESYIDEQIDTVGGEEGYRAILSKLKGELVSPGARIKFEPIKEKLTEDQLKSLFVRNWKHPYLDNWEKISAADGLTRLLGGEIPQPKQLVLLEEIYGTDLIKNVLSKRTLGAKTTDFLVELANLPRALLATADMSAFLRQGVVEIPAHPIVSAKAMAKTFQFAFSPKSFRKFFDDLPKDKLFPLMRKSKLAITDPAKAAGGLVSREEPFISRLLQKTPILGEVVKFAERSYVGFLNKLRVDLFKNWADELLSKGMSPIKDAGHFRAAAKVINTFTGRGSLGKLNRITPELNTLFFSPRLISARFNALNPLWYKSMPKEIRKKAIGDFAKFVTTGLTTLALIKTAAGDKVDVEVDPRSSDFGKIRIGNTRWDIWGGFQQWARVFAQLTTGERKSTTTGEVVSLTKDEYPFTTRKEVLLRFIEGKLAPVPALANELISGAKTFEGEDITLKSVVQEKLIPMYLQDITDAYAEGGLGRAVGAGVPAFLGVGVQTWGKGRVPIKAPPSLLKQSFLKGP